MATVFDFPYLKYYVFVVLLFLILSFVFILINKRIKITTFENHIIYSVLGFNILGLTVGLLVGNSRESIMNVAISSILTLIGVMVVYYFTGQIKKEGEFVESEKFKFILISSILIFFPLSLMYGVNIGSKLRVSNIQYEKEVEVWFQQELNNIQRNSDKDFERYKTELEIQLLKEKNLIEQ